MDDRAKRLTRESYDTNAGLFAARFSGLMQSRTELYEFMNLLGKTKRILDAGCGSGDHSAFFREHGLNVVGIDISPEMVRLSREKDVEAYLIDMQALPFPDNYFDGIWAVTSLLHLPKSDISQVVRKFSKILAPRGIIHAVVKEGSGEGLVQDEDNPQTQRFFAYYGKDEFGTLFRPYFTQLSHKQKRRGHTTFLHYTGRKLS